MRRRVCGQIGQGFRDRGKQRRLGPGSVRHDNTLVKLLPEINPFSGSDFLREDPHEVG